MPITIQHGGPAGTAAGQIIAQAGLQMNQLRQQREMQMAQIDAQADRNRQAADDAMARTALQAGLTEQFQEDEFNREITKMQEQARLQANQFEWKFSAQQRQEIARLNDADQLVRTDPRFSDQDRAEWALTYAQRLAGITPKSHPRDPNAPEPGRGPGDMWKHEETGDYVGLGRSGDLRVLIPYEDTPEGREENHKRAIELEQTKQEVKQEATQRKLESDRQRKLEETIEAKRIELTEEWAPVRDKDGLETGEKQRRTPTQVKEELESLFPQIAAARLEQQGAQQEQEARLFWEKAREEGMELTEEDMDLPSTVGHAQALMRWLIDKYGNIASIPEEYREIYDEAAQIIMQHEESRERGPAFAEEYPMITETKYTEPISGIGSRAGYE